MKLIGEPRENALLFAHGFGEPAQVIDQCRTGARRGLPARFAAPQGADEFVKAFRGVFEHGFGVGRHALFALALQAAAGDVGRAR